MSFQSAQLVGAPEAKRQSLPALKADLLLLHPPAVFEFRGRQDLYMPFLGTSGDVPITPLYEFFPLGFRKLERYLGERGHDVRILNLSSLLLRYRELDVPDLLRALDIELLGIALHWMVHVQGSLAIAELVRNERPDIPILFGGISATYYASELIRFPFVDMVMRGYDTLAPMADLMATIKTADTRARVPNLLWKSRDGHVHDNGLSYAPKTFGCGIDWSRIPQASSSLLSIREITSTHNAGCSFRCGYCGGSGDAFRRIYQTPQRVVLKPPAEVRFELESMRAESSTDQYHLYAMGLNNLDYERTLAFLAGVEQASVRSVNYEQFFLPSDDLLKRMVNACKRTLITLSPDSHDLKVARAVGRGVYTNDELERWLEHALKVGVRKIDIWYFVGLPEQDERSVMETVEYCDRLLRRFKGKADPMICPLIPYLDPASTFFEQPKQYGYQLFCRTLAEHRAASNRASPINRMNYETRWLPRSSLYYVGFRAVRELMEAKARAGMFSKPRIRGFNARIDDAIAFTRVVHEADCISNELERAVELRRLGQEILRRNADVLYSGVIDQTYPIARQSVGRWCDELGWSSGQLEGVVED
jgi:clorobiocin biosynthesis protein CloN6